MFDVYLFIPYFNAHVAWNFFVQRLPCDCVYGITVMYGAYDMGYIKENLSKTCVCLKMEMHLQIHTNTFP